VVLLNRQIKVTIPNCQFN